MCMQLLVANHCRTKELLWVRFLVLGSSLFGPSCCVLDSCPGAPWLLLLVLMLLLLLRVTPLLHKLFLLMPLLLTPGAAENSCAACMLLLIHLLILHPGTPCCSFGQWCNVNHA